MADPGFSLGGHTEGLSEEHFQFPEAATRLLADSHTSEDSAALMQRDSANTVNIRPNRYVAVDEPPFDEEDEGGGGGGGD